MTQVPEPEGPSGVLPCDPPPGDPDEVYAAVTAWAASTGRPLYPHQDEALLHLVMGENVVLATPTGSGKTMVAVAALYAGLAAGRRAWYTAPVKALVSEKFFEMVAVFGAERVGMLTGDSSVNPDAPIICCTAEILAGVALRSGGPGSGTAGDTTLGTIAGADAGAGPAVGGVRGGSAVGIAVLDEFHYYGDRQRGWAWQVPLLELPDTQFLLMSGTLGDVTAIAADLSERTGRPTEVIAGVPRPVPLHFSYLVTDVPEAIRELVHSGRSPAYLVHFTQAAAVERAQGLVGLGLVGRAQRDEIAEMLGDFRFAKGFGRTLSRLVRAGIGVHHAGMLPRYRRLVEKLAQAGLLAVICGTDTLGVGINVPIRTVVITALAKFDGHRSRLLSAREFHQIAGRAGRAGFDTDGDVVVLAPEFAVENAKAEAKAAKDPGRRGKVVKRKAPEGQISWTEQTFDRLVAAQPEQLTSHLRITHAVVLAVLARNGDAVAALRHLIETSHEPRRRQIQLIRRAIAIGRSLLAAGVVRRLPEPDALGRRFVLTADLQVDFALDQPLSPLALAAIDLLDPLAPEYALDVVSVVEATISGPTPLLYAQRDRARGDAVAAMKAEGIEYEQRMALLEDVDYPKPCADLMEVAYTEYRRGHPWVSEYQVEPKSVVREMFSRAMTFSEYIAEYQLARSEGVVLRYLAQCYRALRRTVPLGARTEALEDVIAWLGALVRGVDSSLVQDWEALVHPDTADGGDGGDGAARAGAVAEGGPRGITADRRAFTIMVRNALFRRVELAALRRYAVLGEMDGDAGWGAPAWQEAMEGYFAEYESVGIGPDARSARMVTITPGPGSWLVRQVFDDPVGDHDWGISAEVDLAASDEEGEPAILVTAVGPLTT